MPFFGGSNPASIDLSSFVDQVNAALSSKANAADVQALSQALALKANTGSVVTPQDMNSALAAKADASTVTSALATKANATDLSNLATKSSVSDLAGVVAGKAPAADVSALATTVAGKADATALAPKVNTADLTPLLAQKANLSDLTTMLAGKADASSVAAKANSTDVTTKVLFIQTAVQGTDTVSASTTAEQMYGTKYTIPANSLRVGQTIVLKGSGIYTTSAVVAPTQHARVRVGGIQAVSTSPVGLPLSSVQGRYTYEVQMIVRSLGTTGTLECVGTLMFATALTIVIPVIAGPSGSYGDTGNPITFNSTIANDIQLSCQFSAATAGNSNTIRQMLIYTMIPN